MSFQDLISLASSAVPGLEVGVALLGATYESIENVKIFKQQCRDISDRCVTLCLSLDDGSKGLEGTKVMELVDEITAVVEKINKKVVAWSNLSRVRSFLAQREIKDGIDKAHRDIDALMLKFSMQNLLELNRGHMETRAIQERDRAEMRELLRDILQSHDDMKTLLNMQSSRPVEDMMETLQNELRGTLDPDQEHEFREGLYELHKQTSMLPPLEDLTGQVTMEEGGYTVARGSFNDIYKGSWLDKEPVALRLPRALANSPDVQRRFQREVAIWRNLQHKNVVPLYGTVYFGRDIYFVSPWMGNGTAIAYVRSHPEVDRLRLLREIAEGLEYLHRNEIVHGDLRGANVLIDGTGAARLSDFGLSKFLEDCGEDMTTSSGINPRWFAPELIRENGSLSPASDIWSFGMTALELFTGEQPYADIHLNITVLRELDSGKIPSRPRGLNDELWQLLKRCWKEKPQHRLDISNVKAMLTKIQSHKSANIPTTSDARPLSFPSFRRSTSKSQDNSSRLDIPFRSLTVKDQIPENGQISPLSVHIANGPPHSSPPQHPTLNLSADGPSLHVAEAEITRRTSNASFPSAGFADSSSYPLPPQSSSLPSSFGLHMPSHISSGSNSSNPSRFSSHTPSSSITDSPDSTALRKAAADSNIIVCHDSSNTVVCGTLEGFVDKLVNSSGMRHDLDFRDTFLATCIDFTTPHDVFHILSRRFHEAEEGDFRQAQRRTEIQYNVFAVTKYWISSSTMSVEPDLLWKMKEFCLSALSIKRSSAMNEKAREILHAIDHRGQNSPISYLATLSPGRRVPGTSEITPYDLAIALTLMEGDCYKQIHPTDCLLNVQRSPASTSVDATSAVNNKIVMWVKKSALHYDKLESRAEVLKFFINAAQECRSLRNFSSLTAIASALHSAPIERLTRTMECLPQRMRVLLDDLKDILSPVADHRKYRQVLNDVPDPSRKDVCIPWIAVHLRELHRVLRTHPATVSRDGRLLINFERYTRFMDRLHEVLHYCPPDLEQYRREGQLAYLESQLRNVQVDNGAEDALMRRSEFLKASESRDYRQRTHELRRLGFRTSSQ